MINISTTTGEAFAFIGGLDTAFLLNHDMQRIIDTKIPIVIFKDSEFLLEIIKGNN